MAEEETQEEASSPPPKTVIETAVEPAEEEEKKPDVEAEIMALVAKAKSRLEGVSTVIEENGNRLKTLHKGFRDLRRQQAHVAREQLQAIGSLEHGLKPQ
mmetsp:Transcript_44197/g.104631  ORF Transcript_44197/g.104631 Transcript_44197/m.104631 type:complete len:100 (-) Transcript_44197:90-389(-)